MTAKQTSSGPYKILMHYASGIRDFSWLEFATREAAEEYGEHRVLANSSIVGFKVVDAKAKLEDVHG